jgi:hypothetical protein
MRVLALVVLAACKGFFDPRPPDGPPDSSLATVSFVQANHGTATAINFVSLSFPVAQRQGDLLVAIVEWGAGPSVSNVRDTDGNAWNVAVAPFGSSNTQAMFYAENVAAALAGKNLITVTFNTMASSELRIAEYSGIATSDSLDASQANQATSGTTADSGLFTTTHAHDLLVAGDTTSSTTAGAGSGYTARMITTYGDILEDEEVFDVSSYNADAPLTATGSWVMEVAAFKAAD